MTVSDVDDEGEDCMTPPKPKQKPKRGRPPKKVSSAAVTISSTKKKTAKKGLIKSIYAQDPCSFSYSDPFLIEEQKEDVIEVEEQLDDEDSICIPDPTPTPEDNDDDDFKPRRSLRSRTTVSYRQGFIYNFNYTLSCEHFIKFCTAVICSENAFELLLFTFSSTVFSEEERQ